MPEIETLPGQTSLKKHLAKLLENTPHCLLFEGPRGVGKGEYADTFARAVLKTTKKDPPDLRVFYPEGKAHHHPMHRMKQLIEETALPPFEAACKVFIIHEADRMLPTSSNALLKTLEEPPGSSIIILTSSHPEHLLPTIVSRTFRVPFSLLSEEEIIQALTPDTSEKEARRIALLAHGSLEKARFLASKQDNSLPEQMFHVGFRLLRGDLPTPKECPQSEDPSEALSYLFYFYRDLHLLHAGADPALLFYQDKYEILNKIEAPLPPLESIQDKIDKALLATEVHLPLSHALAQFIAPN